MHPLARLAEGDRKLVQILDAAMAEAACKSGAWLACRLGCTECCMGPFPITQLDALRLRAGLADLAARDPERASAVLQRARDAVAGGEGVVERRDAGAGGDVAGAADQENPARARRVLDERFH